jgi:hypothetical protein
MNDALPLAPRSSAPYARRLLRVLLVLLLLSATVLERFGINAGSASTSVALLIGYAFLSVALALGVLVISVERCLFLGLALCSALVSLLLNETASSAASLLLLCAMYLPLVVSLRPGSLDDADDAGWVMARFLDIGLFAAIFGILQFAFQPLVHAAWWFDFAPYIPGKLRASGTFNTVIPIGSLTKSNGFFFREPSGFSYLMALALVAELNGAKRKLRVLCFALALLLTYSGTGILALVLATLHPFGAKTLLRLAASLAVGAVIFWLFGDALNLSLTLERVGEFNSTHSSGYMRYIAPGRLLGETFDAAPWTPWFGHGPGTIFRTARDYEFHDPTWAKLLFEYGISGFVGFLGVYLAALRGPGIPLQIRATLFWGWLIMGGHLLSPEHNFLALALVGFMPAARALREDSGEAAASLATTVG